MYFRQGGQGMCQERKISPVPKDYHWFWICWKFVSFVLFIGQDFGGAAMVLGMCTKNSSMCLHGILHHGPISEQGPRTRCYFGQEAREFGKGNVLAQNLVYRHSV
jgi:hypothetical protein